MWHLNDVIDIWIFVIMGYYEHFWQIFESILLSVHLNPSGWVMVSVLASSAGDCGIESWSGQTKDYNICFSCFPAKHTTLRNKNKDWLARNRYNVSEWSDMSTHRLFIFQWVSTIKIELSVLVYYKENIILWKYNLFSQKYNWISADFGINNNHTLLPSIHMVYNNSCLLSSNFTKFLHILTISNFIKFYKPQDW